MATPDRRQSTGVNRRASVRASLPSRFSAETDEDIYGMEAMGVSDGFRPTNVGNSNARPQQNRQSTGRRLTPPPRPSSIAKPTHLDSFALRHDGPSTPAPLRPALTGSSSVSTVSHASTFSDATIIRPESPYQGPSGPSHPYQMYPQNTRLARSASVATTSTFPAQPDRPYSGPNGPTHPYGMYPQDTIVDPEDPNEHPSAGIQVGFPGRGVEYRRRLGPDGEEAADLIGPDGHTEQLPPYTKFPVGSFGKNTSLNLPAIEGAGGIGLATRNPEFESQEDILSPQPRRYARSLTSESTTQLDSRPFVGSEKPDERQWKKVARKKMCGILPAWVVCVLILIFILILGTTLGIINRAKNSAKKNDTPSGSSVTVTSTVDATPISVPTGLPPLPTGTYSLQLGLATVAEKSCIADPTQMFTWICDTPPATVHITVNAISGAKNTKNYTFRGTVVDDGSPQINYGTQLPIFDQEVVLTLVKDSQNPLQSSVGPAWFFQVNYNKTVILPENALSITSYSKRKNSARDFKMKGVAAPGQRPWFCYWNGTILETFIYPNATSAAGASLLALTSSSAPTSIGQMSSSSGKPTVSSSGTPSPAVTAMPDQGLYPFYPDIIKVEERSSQKVPPYCVQMQVAQDGCTATPILDPNGNPTTIFISEVIPASLYMRSLEERQGASCSCVWRAT